MERRLRTTGRPAGTRCTHALAAILFSLGLANTLSASTVQMEFVGVNGVQAFSNYVGPYSGLMNGQPVELFCIDFANHAAFGQRWEANLTSLSGASDLSDTRFGASPDALQLYREAAWLTLQFGSQPAGEFGNIHATIWRLFNTSAPVPATSWWLEQAQSQYSSARYDDFRVVTNLGPVLPSGQVQEFLVRVPSAPVPEPGSQLLIGSGLLYLSCLWRRRRTRESARSSASDTTSE